MLAGGKINHGIGIQSVLGGIALNVTDSTKIGGNFEFSIRCGCLGHSGSSFTNLGFHAVVLHPLITLIMKYQ